MKIGIIRNIAGNIEALKRVEQQFEVLGVEVRVCLAQVVGLYPYVDACVDLLIERRYVALRGRVEDEFVGDCRFDGWSTIYLTQALQYTRERVTDRSMQYLAGLPVRYELNGLAFESRADFGDGSLYTPKQVEQAFNRWPQKVIFHAADYDPFLWKDDVTGFPLPIGETLLPSTHRLLISTGGAGSKYLGSTNTKLPVAMVFDLESWTVRIIEVTCNISMVVSDLRRSAYPADVLAALERSEYRKWFS